MAISTRRLSNQLFIRRLRRRPSTTAGPGNALIADILKLFVIPLVLAVAAFYFGQLSERAKRIDQDARETVDHKRKIFMSSAQEFGTWITQFDRLLAVARAQSLLRDAIHKYETDGRGRSDARKVALLKEELKLAGERKERYVKGRDEAKDKLFGNFEQANLFFAPATVKSIDAFQQFDAENRFKEPGAGLPSLDEWRSRARAFFELMKQEIRDDERKLKEG